MILVFSVAFGNSSLSLFATSTRATIQSMKRSKKMMPMIPPDTNRNTITPVPKASSVVQPVTIITSSTARSKIGRSFFIFITIPFSSLKAQNGMKTVALKPLLFYKYIISFSFTLLLFSVFEHIPVKIYENNKGIAFCTGDHQGLFPFFLFSDKYTASLKVSSRITKIIYLPSPVPK